MTLHLTSNIKGRTVGESVAVAVTILLILLATLPSMSLVTVAHAGEYQALQPFRFPITPSSPVRIGSEAGLAKGMFLVASRDLRDPNFSETAVLLIEYSMNGAMGLVINRPSELRVFTVLPEIEGLKQRRDRLYLGGPVARGRMLLLIRSSSQPEGSYHVFEDIYVSSSRGVIQRIIDDGSTEERFRVYAGHAGWAPGQLDREVSMGGWHVLQADAETVFDMAPSEIWPELIRRSSVLWARLQAPTKKWPQ